MSNTISEVRKTIEPFIESAISKVINEPSLYLGVKKDASRTYIKDGLSKLKADILAECSFQSTYDSSSKYISLSDIFAKGKLTRTTNDGIKCTSYRAPLKNVHIKNRNLVTLVFPCRNSGLLFQTSFRFLLEEVRKSYDIDFNIVIQVNNTIDNTIEVISKELSTLESFHSNIEIYILESPPEIAPSLPGSLNIGYEFIKKHINKNKHKNIFWSFWDDELKRIIHTKDSLFNSNMSVLMASDYNKAISGYMIDNRIDISRWHEVSKGFSSDIRFLESKPYLHGGAGMMIRFEDYPQGGIKRNGIADTDLAVDLLKTIDIQILIGLQADRWPIRINSYAPVYHPIENDIASWSIKYLMYRIAWERSLSELRKTHPGTEELWQRRIQQHRTDFHAKLDQYLETLPTIAVLEREFMHRFYKEIDAIKDKPTLYEKLKKYRQRSLNV